MLGRAQLHAAHAAAQHVEDASLVRKVDLAGLHAQVVVGTVPYMHMCMFMFMFMCMCMCMYARRPQRLPRESNSLRVALCVASFLLCALRQPRPCLPCLLLCRLSRLRPLVLLLQRGKLGNSATRRRIGLGSGLGCVGRGGGETVEQHAPLTRLL